MMNVRELSRRIYRHSGFDAKYDDICLIVAWIVTYLIALLILRDLASYGDHYCVFLTWIVTVLVVFWFHFSWFIGSVFFSFFFFFLFGIWSHVVGNGWGEALHVCLWIGHHVFSWLKGPVSILLVVVSCLRNFGSLRLPISRCGCQQKSEIIRGKPVMLHHILQEYSEIEASSYTL